MTEDQQRRAARGSRRPIEDWELPYLAAAGVLLREARGTAGLDQATVACVVGLSVRSLRRLEAGTRRTRRSTLLRLAEALSKDDADAAARLLTRLLDAVGPTLAAESEYAARIDHRRETRRGRAARVFVTEHTVKRQELMDGVLETHVHRVRTSRAGVRERRYMVHRKTP